MDGQTDTVGCTVACSRLKKEEWCHHEMSYATKKRGRVYTLYTIQLCANLSLLSIPLDQSILALYIMFIHESTMNNKVITMVPAHSNVFNRDAAAYILVEAEAEAEAEAVPW